MNVGVDTDFLVAVEINDHPFHLGARARMEELLDAGDRFAIPPQTLAEFIHVVTDPRRMPIPLTQAKASSRAKFWWDAAEVVQMFPDHRSVGLFFEWMKRHRLGRKRILDTLFAAILHARGVQHLISNNAEDFKVFGCFEILGFRTAD